MIEILFWKKVDINKPFKSHTFNLVSPTAAESVVNNYKDEENLKFLYYNFEILSRFYSEKNIKVILEPFDVDNIDEIQTTAALEKELMCDVRKLFDVAADNPAVKAYIKSMFIKLSEARYNHCGKPYMIISDEDNIDNLPEEFNQYATEDGRVIYSLLNEDDSSAIYKANSERLKELA